MSSRPENPTLTMTAVEYLSQIPVGNYDKFHQFMKRFGRDLDNTVPREVFAKAIEYHKAGRDADAQRCLHNTVVVKECIRAKRDWPKYLDELEKDDSDSGDCLANDIEKLRANLPDVSHTRARHQEASLTQPRYDQTMAPRYRDEALPYHVRDPRRSAETDRQNSQHPQSNIRSPGDRGASATPTRAFIPDKDIHPDLIGPWAKKYLGRDAVVEQTTNAGRDGFLVTAAQTPTSEMLTTLLVESKRRFASEPRHASTRTRDTHDAISSHHSTDPGIRHRDIGRPTVEQRPPAMKRPSQADEETRIEVPVTRQSASSPEERHGTVSKSGQANKGSSHMDVLNDVEVSSQGFPDKLQLDWAELDHGMHGKFDNLISLKCFHQISGGARPNGKGVEIKHGYDPNFKTPGILVELDVAWPGSVARNQNFVVDMGKACTAGVVLGKRIINDYRLLNSQSRAQIPHRDGSSIMAHRVHMDESPANSRESDKDKGPRNQPPEPGVGGWYPRPEPEVGSREQQEARVRSRNTGSRAQHR